MYSGLWLEDGALVRGVEASIEVEFPLWMCSAIRGAGTSGRITKLTREARAIKTEML